VGVEINELPLLPELIYKYVKEGDSND